MRDCEFLFLFGRRLSSSLEICIRMMLQLFLIPVLGQRSISEKVMVLFIAKLSFSRSELNGRTLYRPSVGIHETDQRHYTRRRLSVGTPGTDSIED